MSDSFRILDDIPEEPQSFHQAFLAAVQRFEEAAARFEAASLLVECRQDELFSPEERQAVEAAAEQLAAAVERVDEGMVAVQYDSHAWYRIVEGLDTASLRLDSAVGLMNQALARTREGG